MLRFVCILAVTSLLLTSVASAGTVSLSNGTQSAKADWSTDSTSGMLEVWNTTATTLNAGDLLTGIRFEVSGVSAFSLAADVGDLINVIDHATNGYGYIDDFDGSSLKDLSWGLVSGSGYLELRFNEPNAENGIIGPAESDTGRYSKANASIVDNGIDPKGGHNPLVHEYAKFTFNLTQSTGATAAIDNVTFLFGTDLGTHVVPLPSAVWAGLGLLGGIAFIRRVRRRRARI